MDVRSYFANINHQTLLGLLQRQFTSTDLFQLLNATLASFSNNGVGLPIGALTSQYFANHYLDGFQRWLRDQLGVKAELRYMDDVLVFCDSLTEAKSVFSDAHQWLVQQRQLQLKPGIIQYTHIGTTFCGFKVSSKGIYLGTRRKRNLKVRIERVLKAVEKNCIFPNLAQQEAHNIAALAKPGQHSNWLRHRIGQFPNGWEMEL